MFIFINLTNVIFIIIINQNENIVSVRDAYVLAQPSQDHISYRRDTSSGNRQDTSRASEGNSHSTGN